MKNHPSASAPASATIRSSPPPAPEGLRLEQQVQELRHNLERMTAAFDGVDPAAWTLPLPEPWPARIAEVWAPGPARLIDVLAYVRHQEAYVFGRRVMRMLQEDRPSLEYLDFDMIAAYADPAAERPGLHLAEWIKNRLTWLGLMKEAGAFGEIREGDLPPEEGGARIRVQDIPAMALRRDAAVIPLVRDIRHGLGPTR